MIINNVSSITFNGNTYEITIDTASHGDSITIFMGGHMAIDVIDTDDIQITNVNDDGATIVPGTSTDPYHKG